MCLSQQFLASENSGVIGYFGSSRAGWMENKTVEGPSLDFEKAFYKALFSNNTEPKNFARIAALSKLSHITAANEGDAYRWLTFTINPIGDPETK